MRRDYKEGYWIMRIDLTQWSMDYEDRLTACKLLRIGTFINKRNLASHRRVGDVAAPGIQPGK